MDQLEIRRRELGREIAVSRYRYFELLLNNKSLAMKLFGYRASFPNKFDNYILERMKFYVFSGRDPEEKK